MTMPSAALSTPLSAAGNDPTPVHPDDRNAPQGESGVAPEATGKRGRKVRKETDAEAYRAFVLRIMRAYSRRAIAEDPTVLADMVAMRDELDRQIGQAARGLAANGYSWRDIGYELKIDRVAAFKRYAREERP